MSDHLFVYGTLLPGLSPPALAGVASQLRPIGPARMRGQLYDLGFYPGVVLDTGADCYITGYVFALPEGPELLELMDYYERFNPADLKNSLYIRVRQPAIASDGSEIECWMYVYNLTIDGVPAIEGGDYAKFKAEGSVSRENPGLQNLD